MKKRRSIIICIFILLIILLAKVPSSKAIPPGPDINWWPLPPYNTLWPLWSPLLSPPNALGIPIPIVSSLTPDTILPVQPGLTWDPNLDYPWLLYNTPLGMVYYDPLFGVDLWPPNYLLGPLGLPLPIDPSLIPGWSDLAPTRVTWLTANIPVANNAYYTSYPQFAPLLTPASIVGLTLVP